MIYLKTFENFTTNEAEILKYLEDKYTNTWFKNELEERAYDYCDDWEEDYESPSEWYLNHACGGAIEYDLLDEISHDLQSIFKITAELAEKYTQNIFEKNCDWRDKLVFHDLKKADEIQTIMNGLQ